MNREPMTSLFSSLCILVLLCALYVKATPISSYQIYADPYQSLDWYGATELAVLLSKASQRPYALPIIVAPPEPLSSPVIVVGYKAATTYDPTLVSKLSSLGAEGYLMQSYGDGSANVSYVISGGNDTKRGTLYGVYDFLESVVGFRWYTPSFNITPSVKQLVTAPISKTFVPTLEFRDCNNWQYESLYGPDATRWSVIMKDNGLQFTDENMPKLGGGIKYADPPGAVHTAYVLIPPSKYQAQNPSWFGNNQLCWSNTSLIAELIRVVRGILQKQPNANIISVSQNDDNQYCNTTLEQQIINEEGSPAGPILRTVNAIADAIAKDFPSVAISTLAYQYSRKPPLLTKPRPNVIVRLCSIECDFGVPLSDPSSPDNAMFRSDIMGWSNIMDRLYIWDYVVNFANFVMPWPNYNVIAQNIRFYIQYGAKGIFEEGAYKSPGGDLQELKSYVMGKLLWDPSLNEMNVMSDFIDAFYGPQAAGVVKAYINVLNVSVAATHGMGTYSIYVPWTSPYLTPAVVVSLAQTIVNTNRTNTIQKPFLLRYRRFALPVFYVLMLRWNEMLAYATSHNIPWGSLFGTLQSQYDDFADVYVQSGMNDSGLSEGGNGLPWLKKQINL